MKAESSRRNAATPRNGALVTENSSQARRERSTEGERAKLAPKGNQK